MGKFVQSLLRHHRFGPLGDIRRFSRDPVGVQTAVLRNLLTTAAATEWGRRFGFAEIASQPDVVAAYQQRVPLHKYAAFHEDHLRALRGQPDICWPGPVRYAAATSGTSSPGWILPVSTQMIRNDLRFGRAIFLAYLADTGNIAALRGKMLSLPGRIFENPAFPGILMGDMGGCIADYCLNAGLLRKWIARAFVQSPEIRDIHDFDEKAAAIADDMLDKDVRSLFIVPSLGLTVIDAVIERYNGRHGARATTLAEIWPRLQLVVSGGLPLSAYRENIQQRIGRPDLDFLDVYSASESSLAFQSSQDDPAMLLYLNNGVFYEFVRYDEAGHERPRRYTVADVESNVNYLIIVSTCGGLWSYHLGDVVRFTRLVPHKLVVAGRAGEVLGNYGEALFAEEVRGAIHYACQRAAARVRDFHLAPRAAETSGQRGHQWLVEFDQSPTSLPCFAESLDEHLRKVNRAYAQTRSDGQLAPPEVVALPPGLFRQWVKQYRGHIYGTAKVPIMEDGRDSAETMLAVAATMSPSRTATVIEPQEARE